MKFTLEQAKGIAERLKSKYKFGKPSCPAWFRNTCTPMEQDGGYTVSVCIPGWSSISQEEQNVFLDPFEGICVTLRVVVPPTPYKFKEKAKEENVKKKKRSPRR